MNGKGKRLEKSAMHKKSKLEVRNESKYINYNLMPIIIYNKWLFTIN